VKVYEDYTREELIAELKKLSKRKKYGLVWEEERTLEKFERESDGKLPVLIEDQGKEIITDPVKPVNILIEGDNYHALSVLNYTHHKSIDVIYIDPPYNTGNNDFKYNDRFVDREDTYRHSKWLSFMSKRLKLAKNLLKDTGVIIISIDDNEVMNLKLLCDEIFFENNFISLLPTIMNLKGNQDEFGFAGTHEYTLVYAKNKQKAQINEFNIDDEEIGEWFEDENGMYKKGANLKSTGANAPRHKRPNLYYPIFVTPKNKVYVTDNNQKIHSNDIAVYPKTDGMEMSWRWEKKKIKNEPFNIIVVNDNGTPSIYKKQRPKLGDLPSKKPKTIFYKPEYSSGNGTSQLKDFFGEKVINNPKPLQLIKDLLFITGNSDSIFLDFFAGSGTTAQAIMELNKEDGGNRQFILCTNNENNICTDVCYPRIKKVIEGYKNGKGVKVKGLGDNLKYYRTDFVGSEPSHRNKKLLTQKSVETICIKENTFTEELNRKSYFIFSNIDRYTAILFDELKLSEFTKEISKLVKPVSVYIFSLDGDDYKEEFETLKNDITLCAVPEAILKVYRRIHIAGQLKLQMQ
jgi:adenine-specific DNA-methyltransferase